MSVPRSASPKSSGSPSARPRWRTWLFRGALLALGLVVGVGVPYFYVLDKRVRAEFDALVWQVPTRVYARPQPLVPGTRLDADTLLLELAAAGYREDGGELPGTWTRDGKRFDIATRAFTALEGPVPGRQLSVLIDGGRVATVTDRKSGKPVDDARLDPARIATLYGDVTEERRLV